MKSFVAVLIILSIIIALVTVNSVYVTSVFSELSELSDNILNESEGYGTENILLLWQRSKALLSVSIEADELERMNDLIESLRHASAINDTPAINKYCRLISELSNELMSYEQISIQSIF